MYNTRSYPLLFCFLNIFLLWNCSGDTSENQSTNQVTESKEPVTPPAFSADSAYTFIEDQVNFGPRVPNTEAHKQCGKYLQDQLAEYGAEVSVQDFDHAAYDGTVLHLQNIIASFRPQTKKRILLAAHWDTRPVADRDSVDQELPIDGANDGASGVGVLLEVARQLQQMDSIQVGVDLILFDGEDYGEPEGYQPPQDESQQTIWWCLGSQYWAKNKHQKNYLAYYGVLLDMVGAKEATFYQEEVSRKNAGVVNKKIWEAAHRLGYENYFVSQDSPEILDDHVFVNYNAGIPMVDIIEYDPDAASGYFGAYHHTHQDNMEVINRETLLAVGETLLYAIAQEE